MRAIEKAFVVWTLGLVVLSGSSAVSWALPRNQLPGGECRCFCTGPHLPFGAITGLPNQFGGCAVYNGKTCNGAVPNSPTGEISTGKTEHCCQVLDNDSCVESSPTGATSVVKSRGALPNALLAPGAVGPAPAGGTVPGGALPGTT